jgi:hypothetical protein
MGALGHPEDIPQSGLVPGLTDWEYFFHGKGCCLTHRGSGEAIDVDFFGETAEYFDIFFCLNYLKSLKNPEPPEARLIALNSSFQPIRLVVGELLDSGMLTPLEGGEYPFRISEDVLSHEDAIDRFCDAWENPDRQLWLAALVGDWLAACELALVTGDRDLIELTTRRAAACKDLRCRELLGHWESESKRSNVLLALDDLGAEELREQLDLALGGPLGGVTSAALEFIQRQEDPVWCDAVHRLFRRTRSRVGRDGCSVARQVLLSVWRTEECNSTPASPPPPEPVDPPQDVDLTHDRTSTVERHGVIASRPDSPPGGVTIRPRSVRSLGGEHDPARGADRFSVPRSFPVRLRRGGGGRVEPDHGPRLLVGQPKDQVV